MRKMQFYFFCKKFVFLATAKCSYNTDYFSTRKITAPYTHSADL